MKILDTKKAFPAVVNDWNGRGELIDTYNPMLADLRHVRASGVYAVLDARSRDVLYVGESHSGRLYDTITRHFRKWRPRKDRPWGKTGGVTFDRTRVLLSVVITSDADAVPVQYAEIQRLEPKLNQVGYGEAASAHIDDLPV